MFPVAQSINRPLAPGYERCRLPPAYRHFSPSRTAAIPAFSENPVMQFQKIIYRSPLEARFNGRRY
jgi:hypothetical protein